MIDVYDADHAAEWMERHPHGWYNSESDKGTGDEPDTPGDEDAEFVPGTVRDVLECLEWSRQISDEYWGRIVDAIADDVAADVAETADPEHWNMDDVRLSVGRVLCDRLGLEH